MGSKTWSEKSYATKRKKLLEYAENYGIDHSKYNTEFSGRGQFSKESWEDLEDEITRRSANDYDVRRSMDYAQEVGKDGPLGEIRGISNMDEAHSIHNAMKKVHRKQLDGGNFSSANDYANVMGHFAGKAQEFRDKKLNEMLDKRFEQFQLDQEEAQPEQEETRQPSERFLQSQQRVKAYEGAFGNAVQLDPHSIFRSNGAPAPDQEETDVSSAQKLLNSTKQRIADQLKPASGNPDGF